MAETGTLSVRSCVGSALRFDIKLTNLSDDHNMPSGSLGCASSPDADGRVPGSTNASWAAKSCAPTMKRGTPPSCSDRTIASSTSAIIPNSSTSGLFANSSFRVFRVFRGCQ